jgi:hypothetical protein
VTDPSIIAAGTVLKLAFDEFIKTSAGEAAKKLTGEALERANDLRKTICSYITEKKNQKAIDAFSEVETQGSETALIKLEVYLEIAMETDEPFAQQLRFFAQEIEVLRTTKHIMLEGFEGKSLEADNLIQDAVMRGGKLEQIMLQDVKAETAHLRNLTQKSQN